MSWLDRAKPLSPAEPVQEESKSPSWLSRAVPTTEQPVAQEPVEQKEETPSWLNRATAVTPPVSKPVPESNKPSQPPSKTNGEYLAQSEIESIANKHGINPSDLRSVAPYYGVKLRPGSLGEAVSVGAKSSAGFAGRSALLGIPQFLYKKTQDEGMRKAIDELQGIANKQETPLETAAEIVASPVAGFGKNAVTRIASTTGLGAAQGAATSKEGEELKGAAQGAAFGGALATGGEIIGKVLNRLAPTRVTKPGQIDTVVPTLQADVGGTVEKKLAQRADTDPVIEKAVLSNEQPQLEDVNKFLTSHLGAENVPRFRDTNTEEGRILRRSLQEKGLPVTNENINLKLVDDIIENDTRSFARELSGSETTPSLDEARSIISTKLERDPTVPQKYKDWVETRTALDAIEEHGLRATDQPGFLGRASEFLSTNEYVARHIDDKYARNIEKILRDGSQDFNKSTFTLSNFRNANDKLSDFADSIKVGEKIRQHPENIYEALDTGNFNKLSPEEKQFADKFKQVIEMYRNNMNATGRINIPRIQNYVPKTVLKTEELVPAVESKLKSALDDATNLTGRKIEDIGQLNNLEITQLEGMSPALKDLLGYKRFVSGEPQKKVLPGELSAFIKESLYSPEGRRKLDLIANSSIERTEGGSIPNWLLEKDPFRLLDKWSMNTVRAAYLGPTISKLRNEVKILKKLGADVDASTIQKIGEDLLGPRKNTMASATLNARVGFQKQLDKLIDTVGGETSRTGKVLNNLRVLPEVTRSALQQIYPNVLGGNPASLITNLGGNYTKMLPELGNSPYGMKLATEATAKNMVNFKKNLQIARELGNVPAEFTRNQNRAIAEGVQRNKAYKAGSATTDALNKTSLYLFGKTEEFNRGVVVELAKQLSKDLQQGNVRAIDVVNKMPVTMRKHVMQNLQGNPDEVTAELARYFNSVIAQNYNKLSASEFARTAGPLFSAFTKWPSVALGQAAYELKSKPLLEGAARVTGLVGTPWLVLSAIDYATGERSDRDEDERSDRLKKIVGSEGASKLAPVGSLKSLATGDFFTPPALGLAKKAGSSLADPNKEFSDVITSTSGEVIRNFVPGAGLLKFFTQDLPTLMRNEPVEGDNFFERTEEGLNTWKK